MEAALNLSRNALRGSQWLIFTAAGIGFAFDMYELVVQATIVGPVLTELGPYQPGTAEFNFWRGMFLFLPTVVGGLAALGGGYLTDLIGRQRVLVWSIVLYALAALMSGFAGSLYELMFWRCITVAGTCVEFVAAIAWLAELNPDPKRRETMLGYTQACATLGNFMIAGAWYAAVTWGDWLPAVHGGHSAWRYALMFGALPAIPLALIRPFLPESPVWREKKAAGTLRRPRIRELLEPRLRRVTLLTTLLVGCCYALAFGMLQYIPGIVPGLPQVSILSPKAQQQWVSWVHVHVDTGALIGRFILAGLVVWFAARRPMLRWLLVLGLLLYPCVFLGPALRDANYFKYAVLFVSMLVAVQYSLWGNCLPRMFPLHLRGTGESFAMTFGARMLAPLMALLTANLATVMPGATHTLKLAHSVAFVAVLASLIALVASRWMSEPPAELSEE